MNFSNFILIIAVAASYYLFSNEFFKFSAEIKEKRSSHIARFFSFFIIYVWFIFASYLELPLVINWFIFAIMLGFELHFVFSYDFLMSYALSLFCVITSLAVNILFRSLASISLHIPINNFDKTISSVKRYPIFLGFIVMALLLHVLRRIRFTLQLQKMLHYRKSLIFYTWTELFIYLFLIIQLLAFSQSGDTLGIKVWGIKSSCFSVIILIIAIIYSLRVASLHYFMEKQHNIRTQLIREKEDVNKLWSLAFTDMLTGCSNRQLLNKRLEEYAGYGGSITIAFIDINGLKKVNDQYGHLEGDNYLVTVSRLLGETASAKTIDLFRYGGDEFVMISNTLQPAEITALLAKANDSLKSEQAAPYIRSISFGVVHGDCTEYKELLDAADGIMYQHKMKHYAATARS